MRVLAVLLLLLLVSCASPSDGDPAADGASPGPGTGGADDELVVEVDPGEGAAVERWTLVCGDVAAGDHPDAQAACDHLQQLPDPFAPIPDDAVCTEQYGGPQTAHVTGRWAGEPVDLRVSRTDGCRIAQWDSLVPLVPAAQAFEELPG